MLPRLTVTIPADPQLNSYQRKKYVAKLVFTYILGYKVDVGHFEAANLVTSNKYTEKQIVWTSWQLSKPIPMLRPDNVRRDI